MPTFTVRVPMYSHAVFDVDAENAEEAIKNVNEAIAENGIFEACDMVEEYAPLSTVLESPNDHIMSPQAETDDLEEEEEEN